MWLQNRRQKSIRVSAGATRWPRRLRGSARPCTGCSCPCGRLQRELCPRTTRLGASASRQPTRSTTVPPRSSQRRGSPLGSLLPPRSWCGRPPSATPSASATRSAARRRRQTRRTGVTRFCCTARCGLSGRGSRKAASTATRLRRFVPCRGRLPSPLSTPTVSYGGWSPFKTTPRPALRAARAERRRAGWQRRSPRRRHGRFEMS